MLELADAFAAFSSMDLLCSAISSGEGGGDFGTTKLTGGGFGAGAVSGPLSISSIVTDVSSLSLFFNPCGRTNGLCCIDMHG